MERADLITAPINTELTRFKALFAETLQSENPLLDSVLKYVGQRSGKMMRPVLMLLIGRLCGEVNSSTYHAAIALELLHTASLIHDDVVDESGERRGQPSVNAMFNSKVSVLAGDYLLGTSLLHAERTKSYRIVEIVARLGQELADGEILQLLNIESREFSEETYYKVIDKKTAVLFAAGTEAAACSADADAQTIETARLLGRHIGLCFQIKDDLFDYDSQANIGKPTGNDMREGKLTLPVLHVLNRTQDAAATALAHRVKAGEATAEEIARLVDFTKANGGLTYAETVMEQYRRQALDLLATFPTSAVRTALEAYVDYVSLRNK